MIFSNYQDFFFPCIYFMKNQHKQLRYVQNISNICYSGLIRTNSQFALQQSSANILYK